jgi:hypothetical protein
MTVRFEDIETPGFIRIVDVEQNAQAITLDPQEAINLLHWLYERRDLFEQVLHPEPPTQKLPKVTLPTQNE